MRPMRFFVGLLLSAVALVGCEQRRPYQPAPLPPAPVMQPVFEAPRSNGERVEIPNVAQQITQYVPSAEHAPPVEGNFGYTPNPEATRAFLQGLEKPTLREAAPHLFEENAQQQQVPYNNGATADPPVLLYRALYHVQPDWIVGSQGIGDCVSWGWAHACDISLAIDKILGRTGQWHPAATEAIYGGSRVEARGRPEGGGGWSDGSYGSAAAKWVNGWGVVYRQPFAELGYDLTRYDSRRAKNWGNWGNGGEGDRGRLDAIAKQHPVGQVALVRNFEEAATAIANGYPVPVCSGQGFSKYRDKDGFATAQGSWAHCMVFVGVRYDRPGLLCLNSWGPTWISGPKWPPDNPRGPPEERGQPDGSFWVDASVVTRMLAGQDSFAVSQIKGFPGRKLRHSEGW